MRFFCIIFSFYLLFLSWQPCQDITANKVIHQKNYAEQPDFHVTQEQNETDDCSPFCICSCCQTSVTYANLFFRITNIITNKITSKTSAFYQNPDEKTYQNSIWQPPKLRT